MNTTFDNAQAHHARRAERQRRQAELEAAYDAAVTGNTRAFHQRMEAADNYLLDRKYHGDERDYDDGEGSAWFGIGIPPPDGIRGGFCTRAVYCIKAKRFHIVLATMLVVAVGGIVAAFATPSKGRVGASPSRPTGGEALEDGEYYMPDRAPSASHSRADYFRSIIVGSKVSSEDVLYDDESPQGRAFAWLLDDDSVSLYGGGERYEPGAVAIDGSSSVDAESNAVLIRYALAVLYYSTTSTRRDESFDFEETVVAVSPSDIRLWTHSDLWLSGSSVCRWHGVTCFGQYDEAGNPIFTSSVMPASADGIVVPHSFGPVLISLNLTDNELDGQIPPELFTGLGPNLRILDLSANDLSGSIPSEIGHASSIDKLYLDRNPRLTGSVPRTLGTVSHLQYLYLNGCALTGSIPSEVGHLTRLRGLGLHENALTGLVPASLGGLKELYVLYLDENELEGVVPASLSGLTNLADLRLRHNKFEGHLPPLPGRLEVAYLDSNDFTGTLPVSYGDLLSLAELHLYNNHLGGTLPASLGNLDDLTLLYLDHNHFNSSIPSSFAKLTDLKALYLFDNNFTGAIDPIVNMTDLEHLRLSNNAFSGTVSEGLGTLYKLQDLFLDHNSFQGGIPKTLGALHQLENFRLEGNHIKGKVPRSLCTLREALLQNFGADCLNDVECRCCTQCV